MNDLRYYLLLMVCSGNYINNVNIHGAQDIADISIVIVLLFSGVKTAIAIFKWNPYAKKENQG